jgi:hypothetical protein
VTLARASGFQGQRTKMRNEFHLQWFGPCEPHWPQGGWSVYRISGDEIAQRIKCDENGKVLERHSWCGYIGIYKTLPEVMAAIGTQCERNALK